MNIDFISERKFYFQEKINMTFHFYSIYCSISNWLVIFTSKNNRTGNAETQLF